MSSFGDAIRSPAGDGTVTLRPWEPVDAPAVLEALRDPEIQRWTPLPRLESAHEAEDWIEARLALDATDRQHHFAIVDARSGEVAGGVNIFLHDARRAELGYFTTPRLRRRGLATRATRLATRWAHSKGIERLEALIDVENVVSGAVVRAGGFRQEGLLRGFRVLHGVPLDMHMFARLSGDPVSA